jgi:hypothetical protein
MSEQANPVHASEDAATALRTGHSQGAGRVKARPANQPAHTLKIKVPHVFIYYTVPVVDSLH